jgi:hypothetical protein
MKLDASYYDFLFDSDHARKTTCQMRCGLSIDDVMRLTQTPDPLTAPLAWCKSRMARLQLLPPEIAALLVQADIAAWQRELELAEANDNGCRGNQTPGGDLRPD